MIATKKIAIVMGSDSDLPIMVGAARVLDRLGIDYHVDFVSAHRTPNKVAAFAEKAAKNGFAAIIAGAGGAAHLPGMLAAHTTLPVIGVPIASATIGGGGFVDALPSIVQMPPGVPVATMGVNRAENAGIFAAQILGAFDRKIAAKLKEYKGELEKAVLDKCEVLGKLGHEEYLAKKGKESW